VMVGGDVYQGTGVITGDIENSSESASASLELMGGRLVLQ